MTLQLFWNVKIAVTFNGPWRQEDNFVEFLTDCAETAWQIELVLGMDAALSGLRTSLSSGQSNLT